MTFNTIGLGDGVWLTYTWSDILVSFDTVSLFANAPVEVLEIIRKNCRKMTHWLNIWFWRWMPLWSYWKCVIKLQTSNWQVLPQKMSMAMGSSLFPVITEHFKNLVFNMAEQYTSLWLWCVHDTFAIWCLGFDSSLEFLNHINSWKPAIKHTTEAETASAILFMDDGQKERMYSGHQSLQKTHTHTTGHYLHFLLNYPSHVQRGVVQSLYHISTTICKSPKTTLTKLIFWDMTCTLVPIPLGLFIQL